MRSRVSVHRIQSQTHVSSSLRTISVMKDFNLSRHYYNCTEYNVSCCTWCWAAVLQFWMMLYVQTNLLCLSFNKSIDMLKMAFEHGKYEINVCWFNQHTKAIYLNDILGSGHPQNAPEYRKSHLPNVIFLGEDPRPPIHDHPTPTTFITSHHWSRQHNLFLFLIIL